MHLLDTKVDDYQANTVTFIYSSYLTNHSSKYWLLNVITM